MHGTVPTVSLSRPDTWPRWLHVGGVRFVLDYRFYHNNHQYQAPELSNLVISVSTPLAATDEGRKSAPKLKPIEQLRDSDRVYQLQFHVVTMESGIRKLAERLNELFELGASEFTAGAE